MFLDILENTKGSMRIILFLERNKHQKPDISRIIDNTGIPRQTCYMALHDLTDAGLVSSTKIYGRPQRVVCELTDKGSQIAVNLIKIENVLESTIEGFKRQIHDLSQISRTSDAKEEFNKKMLGLLIRLERECFSCGQWDDAINYGKRIAKLSRKLDDNKRLAQALRNIGEICRMRQSYDEALKYFDKSLNESRAVNDFEGMASDYYNRGTIFEGRDNYVKALEQFDLCGKYAQKCNSDIGMGRACLGRGRILAYSASFRESVEVLEKAQGIFERIGEVNDLLMTYTSLGASEFYIDINKAIDWHDKCRELSKRVRNVRMQGYALSNLSGCYIEKGLYGEAKRCLSEALPIFERLNERTMVASILIHYARMFRQTRDWSNAKHYLERARNVARAIRDKSKIADIGFVYGLLHKDRGNITQAKRSFKTALRLFKEVGETDSVKEVQGELEELTAL
jgi:tetratricopeptide (TPR) repeat protein